jgi:hypothetical protein
MPPVPEALVNAQRPFDHGWREYVFKGIGHRLIRLCSRICSIHREIVALNIAAWPRRARRTVGRKKIPVLQGEPTRLYSGVIDRTGV